MGDGEDADAALRAAGFADEVMAAAAVGVGYGVVYDLDETQTGRHGVRPWRRRDSVGFAYRWGMRLLKEAGEVTKDEHPTERHELDYRETFDVAPLAELK